MLSNAFDLKGGSYFGTVRFDLLTYTNHQKNLKMKLSLSTDTLLVWINLTCTLNNRFLFSLGRIKWNILLRKSQLVLELNPNEAGYCNVPLYLSIDSFVILNSWLVPPVKCSSFTSIVWKLCRTFQTSLSTQDFSFESLEMFAQREKTSHNHNIVALVVWKRPGAEWCWHGSWVLQSLHHEWTMMITWSEKRVIFLCTPLPGLT